jgi:UTP--glucose-1-phosphate uridylyltransferase
MSGPVKYAVFPLGGAGSRLLPITYATPKWLVPVGYRSLLHHAMREARAAEIDQFILVLGRHDSLEGCLPSSGAKRLLCAESENNELTKANRALLEDWLALAERVTCVVPMRLDMKPGLASAIASAESIVGDNRFAVLLTDAIVFTPEQGLKAVIKVAQAHRQWAIGLTRITREQFKEFGVVQVDEERRRKDGSWPVLSGIEKPGRKTGYRGLGIAGRYLFHNDVFDRIRESEPIVKKSSTGFHVTEAINLAARHRRDPRVSGLMIESKFVHAGTLQGYWAAWKHWLETEGRIGPEAGPGCGTDILT